MADWKSWLAQLGYKIETHFDKLKWQWKQRGGRVGPVQILAYHGYGTYQKCQVWGRVLEDKGISDAVKNAPLWQNLLAMYKRFESDEIPGVRVRVRLHNAVQEVVTDPEGYFVAHLQPTELERNRTWHTAELSLVDEVVKGQGLVHTTGQVFVPPLESAFGVISDIDDTILKTYVTDWLKMVRLTLLHNAQTRLPFEGVAAFYRALQRGPDGVSNNPLFYVSSSPWNLYDLLTHFMAVHDIPTGPLLLRDFGLNEHARWTSSHQEHKKAYIERLLLTYPELTFILIGDSGQQDPEIYRQIVLDFPGRIRAVYIRNVTSQVRDATVRALAADVRAQGIDMLLVEDTDAAAAHALASGFITCRS